MFFQRQQRGRDAAEHTASDQESGNDAATNCADQERRNKEPGNGCFAHYIIGNREGNKAADQAGANNFTEHSCFQVAETGIHDAGKKGAYHAAGEG